MKDLELYYATNRRHVGRDRWRPTSYGKEFSSDGMENLRFGKVSVKADEDKVARYLKRDVGFGRGDGEGLCSYLAKLAKSRKAATIRAFAEKLDSAFSDANQPPGARYGSRAMFEELRAIMAESCDVLVYIHGFNVAWNDAVGAALALQEMVNLPAEQDAESHKTTVVLFTWPSDGSALPYVAYKSDRSEAHGSSGAFGRGLLKVRDFLFGLTRAGSHPCDRALHLLCHSMGNYVLENALARMAEFTPGRAMPRIFEHVFLCSADVDDDALEEDRGLGTLHEITRGIGVYFNRGDTALHISDFTKGNPERLGTGGAARPSAVHAKIEQIDCSDVIGGLVEHSYYLSGNVNRDIRLTLAGSPPDAAGRDRVRSPIASNTWALAQSKDGSGGE